MGRHFDPATSRALRRAHKARMKRKAVKVYYFNDPDQAIKLADHLHPCSVPWCCGNPRRLGHKTMQERRAQEAALED